MNLGNLGNLNSYIPGIRTRAPLPVEQSYNPPAKKVATEVDSLSDGMKFDLSQKAQAQPPAPKTAPKKKSAPAPKPSAKQQASKVQGKDFAGRTCSGNLNGPLLMEDPMAANAAQAGFQISQFNFNSSQDIGDLRSGALLLGGLGESILHAPASENPLAQIQSGDTLFSYYGVDNGSATLKGTSVKSSDSAHLAIPTKSAVTLPDGQIVEITRNASVGELLSIRLPEASLSELAEWGRGLLAVA